MLLAPETKVTVTEAPARVRHSTSDLFLLTCLPKTTPTLGIFCSNDSAQTTITRRPLAG